jgi:hypothetical protein
MLEKLFGVGSFGGYINHLIHYHTILFISSDGFGLPFMVWTTTPAFLGCWALIAFALVIHFQQDDRLIFLNAIAHVEIGISPF